MSYRRRMRSMVFNELYEEHGLTDFKRSDFYIISEILSAVKEGPVGITRLLGIVDVNHKTMVAYLNYMEKTDLITRSSKNGWHKDITITEKGKAILWLIRDLLKYLEPPKRTVIMSESEVEQQRRKELNEWLKKNGFSEM